MGWTSPLLVAAVVEMVSVAVPALALVISTGLVVPKLKVGESCAPEGLAVIDAVSVTLPVNPPLGVTVMVEMLAVVAPGFRATAEPVTVKPGVTTTGVTVKVAGAEVEPAFAVSPPYVAVME